MFEFNERRVRRFGHWARIALFFTGFSLGVMAYQMVKYVNELAASTSAEPISVIDAFVGFWLELPWWFWAAFVVCGVLAGVATFLFMKRAEQRSSNVYFTQILKTVEFLWLTFGDVMKAPGYSMQQMLVDDTSQTGWQVTVPLKGGRRIYVVTSAYVRCEYLPEIPLSDGEMKFLRDHLDRFAEAMVAKR